MIDATLIVRKINLISQDFKGIVELSRKSLQEFLASRVDEVLAERYLERMIGRMIDINYHLSSDGPWWTRWLWPYSSTLCCPSRR